MHVNEDAPPLRILVIDDHPFFLDGLRIGLQSLPDITIEVDQLPDARQALDEDTGLVDYDLILCDLNLPEINGIRFIETLVERELYVRVAIISASESERDVQEALRAGAAGFINKGLQLEGFKQAIFSILAGERYVPPRTTASTDPVMSLDQSLDKLGITARQYEVLKRLADGMSNKEISVDLAIKESTVKSHLQVLFQIFAVGNRTACLVKARSLGLIGSSTLSL